MSLAAGTRVGPYEIVAPLGAGGMGEVYRARDPRLGRDVAIKALPAAFATDPERLARFEREARLLASLSHPNLAAIYGLEEVDGARYLALELVEGETLAARLGRGPLPVDEALDVARQIAAGVEAAHENDVIHRDLKPANVMLATSGAVKVLDFGLAKGGAGTASGSAPDLSQSPTITYAVTGAGVILGTAAYMSPEQARGRAVDKRTDVWSFGCIVFECLTGRQAFGGETVSDIVARILQTDPEWTSLPGTLPERVRALLARSLEKDAKRRLRDIGDARIEIEDVLATRKSARIPVAAAAGARPGPAPWLWIAGTAVLVAAGSVFATRQLMPPAPVHPARFEISAPKSNLLIVDGQAAAISPDGRMLAMGIVDSSGTSSIWVRRIDELTPHRLPGTEGVRMVFWSPDSRWLGFFANDQTLAKIAVDGGTPEKIADTHAARGGAWGKDGTILFAPTSNGGIFRVSANGGTPVQLTRPDSAHGVTGHRFPVFLPDGKHFLFSTIPAGDDGRGGVCVGSVDGGPTREICRAETGAVYAAPGWLLTSRNTALVAWKFDPGALKVIGDPVVIGDPLVGTQFSGGPVLSASRQGSLAYLTRYDVPLRAIWCEASTGRPIGAPPLPVGLYGSLSLAPDMHRAAITVQVDPTRIDLVLADLDRGVTSRLSQPPELVSVCRWSHDGSRIAYLDEMTRTLRVRSLTDGSMKSFLAEDHAFKRLYGWMPGDQALLYGRLDATTKWDIWMLPLDGGPPKAVLCSPANDEGADVSIDGKWLCYSSDESGVSEACLAPFATPALKYQVTIGGGGAGFSFDGKRLYFLESKTPNVYRVAAILPGPPVTLGPSSVAIRTPPEVNGWDLTHDEKRLLALVPTEKPAPQAVTLLENWTAAIRKP